MKRPYSVDPAAQSERDFEAVYPVRGIVAGQQTWLIDRWQRP